MKIAPVMSLSCLSYIHYNKIMSVHIYACKESDKKLFKNTKIALGEEKTSKTTKTAITKKTSKYKEIIEIKNYTAYSISRENLIV